MDHDRQFGGGALKDREAAGQGREQRDDAPAG